MERDGAVYRISTGELWSSCTIQRVGVWNLLQYPVESAEYCRPSIKGVWNFLQDPWEEHGMFVENPLERDHEECRFPIEGYGIFSIVHREEYGALERIYIV